MSAKVSTRFSLREVAELTGLSEFTLRGWEGRYSAVQPVRTPTGRRVYRTEDVVKLNLLKDLVALGHRIGEIAAYPESKLRHLLSAPLEAGPKETPVHPRIQQLFVEGERFAWQEVSGCFDVERNARSGKSYLREFLIPFLNELNRRIAAGRVSISLEHIFSSMIKEELARVRAPTARKGSSKRFLLCTPEGDHHELGLLIAYTALNLNGIQSLYLGPHVPKQELCETALRYRATHILLTSTLNQKEGAVEDPIKLIGYLRRHLPQFTELWIAGRALSAVPEKTGNKIKAFASFNQFFDHLSEH